MTNWQIISAAQHNANQDKAYALYLQTTTETPKKKQSEIAPRLSVNYGYVKQTDQGVTWRPFKRDLTMYKTCKS